MRYRVFRPGAGVVSYHRGYAGAEKSLARQRAGAAKQGGYCQDWIEWFDGREWLPSLYANQEVQS